MNDDAKRDSKVSDVSNGTSDATGRQDPETIRMWMGAYLDGELENEQEAALMRAIDADSSLAEEFEHLCQAFCGAEDLPSFVSPSFVSPSFLAAHAASPNPNANQDLSSDRSFNPLSSNSLSSEQSQQLEDSILAATVPQTLSSSPDAAAQLASQLIDNALSPAGSEHLATMLNDPPLATSTLNFMHAAEATQATVSTAASHPDIQEALAFSSQAVMDTVAADERAGITWMAYGDAEVDVSELDRVLSTADADRLSAVALQPHALEGISAALRSIENHPAAARAGSAALQAIAAEKALAASSATEVNTKPAVAAQPTSYFDRLRGALSNLAAPLVFAGGAAALFVGVGGYGVDGLGNTAPPTSVTKTPPLPYAVDPASVKLASTSEAENPVKLAWIQGEMFTTLAGEILNEETALREFDAIEILADNSETEVQTLESGASSTMVFSTEASHITVIWVPDAGNIDDVDETGGNDKTEMGT